MVALPGRTFTAALLLLVALIVTQFATGPQPILLTSPMLAHKRRLREISYRSFLAAHHLILAATANNRPPPALRPPSRFSRRFRRDPLSKYRAVTGVKARIRWWERLRGLLGLGAMIVVLGAGIALMVVLFFAGLRVFLELIIE